jgi:adenine deaminase
MAKKPFIPYINKRLIRVGLGEENADLVIKNGNIVNVFTLEIEPGDIAIADGRIAAVGDVQYCTGDATQIIDVSGYTLTPGLIDPHIHPEVTKLTMTRLAEIFLARGTTTIMSSFDQVGVVAGIEGIRFVLDEVKQTPLKVFHCSPSRLPYTTPASTIATTFGPQEHELAMTWEESVGMWEYMIDSIATLEDPVLESAGKLLDSFRMPQGHLPFTSGPLLNGALAAGVCSDHESWFAPQVAEKLKAGLYVFLRKASCVDNITEGLKAITEMGLPTRRLSLCADDIDCMDIVELGHMDHYLRLAMELGVDPLQAIQMVTLNAAEAFRVDHLVGAITPGRFADILVVKDIKDFSVHQTFANGKLVASDGAFLQPLKSPTYPTAFYGTMKLNEPITDQHIYLTAPKQAKQAQVIVMHLEPLQIRTRREASLPVVGGNIMPDPEQGIAYISVTDRHSGKGKTASALISGFDLKQGAFATSLSPDDDNIICIGASVSDMTAAINHLFDIDGGQVVVADGKVVADIRLPLCGFMADILVQEMAAKEAILNQKLFELGVKIPKPFFSILFLSITAIPEYSITDQGFVEAASRNYIDPILSWS